MDDFSLVVFFFLRGIYFSKFFVFWEVVLLVKVVSLRYIFSLGVERLRNS